jgi:prepilin-type N-terminal cleavage/methylation domain-containing protein
MSINTKRGFTLMELLVVIAIIGILASVVLASLNSARNKGADAAIKSNLANARAEAELYYDSGNTYLGVCALTGTNIIGDNASSSAAAASATYVVDNNRDITATQVACHDAAGGWAMGAPLKSGGAWCVDSTGASKAVALTALDTNGDITCD